MFWKKRKLPKPNEAQVLLESARRLIGSLMNSSYSMPSHISRGMDDWLDEYSETDMEVYKEASPNERRNQARQGENPPH